MGSSIDKIYDDYKTYVAFCSLVKEQPTHLYNEFYNHEDKLMEKHGYVSDGGWYKKKEDMDDGK